MLTERSVRVSLRRARQIGSRSGLTRVLLITALAGCCATVLYARVYQQFDRVRVKVVTTEHRPSGGSVVVPLPDLSGLAGFPPAVVLRLENRDRVATTVSVFLNAAELARVALPPERTVRVDLSPSVGAGLALSSARIGSDRLRLSGEGDGWALHYLEVANVHGFSHGFFSFVIVPSGSDRYDSASAMASLSVFGIVWVISLVLFTFSANRTIRVTQTALGLLVLIFFVTTLVIATVSPYKVLLSRDAFWLCVAILYSPVLVRAGTPARVPLQRASRVAIDALRRWYSVAIDEWVPALLRLIVLARGSVPTLSKQQATRLGRTLDVFSLVALAVAYPIFDVLSQSPEFFAARNSTVGNVIALVFTLCVVLPAAIVGVELVVEKLSAKAAGALHGSVLVVLVVTLVMPWFKQVDQLGPIAPIALAVAVGAIFGVGHVRTQATRLFVTALSPAVLIVPAVFLLDQGIRGAVVPTEQPFIAPEIERAPPVVFIVFDEFPLNSLLNADREIDSGRYPHFSALAADAYWFRDATTVSSNTVWSVPAMVSGRYPTEPGAVPTRRYYPNNVFTMLSAQYEITVFGRFLQLCPPAECVYDLDVPGETLRALISDLGIVWLHIVLPEVLTETLPTIVGDWRGFAADRRWRNTEGGRQRNEPSAEFDRFLATIGGSKASRFYFLHTMLPHMPFRYVPSGRRYEAPDYQGTFEQSERLFERASAGFADVVHQRHLLQVGFVDHLLGRLLDRLKEQGIYDEALIIITADHGASYREGMSRRTFREENSADIILIPLFVKVPGQVTGIISDRPVETIDILPTIASVLSIDMPFDVDGQSLIDFTLPERGSKTFIRRNLSRIRPIEVENLADVAERILQSKVNRFGTGTDEGLYSVGGTASLLGVNAAEYADPRRSDVRVTVGRPNRFKEIDLTQESWPLYVRGTVEAGGLQPVRLAVAMNGRVAATTESYREGGEWVFATVLPEEYLRHGTNDLQVFLIDDTDGSLALRSTSSRRPDRK